MSRKQFVARVSDVEALRYCREFEPKKAIETDEDLEKAMEWFPTEEKVLQNLVEGLPPNSAMLAGTLGHKVLEETPVGQSVWYATDDVHQIGLFFGEVDLEAPFYHIKEQRLFKTYPIGNYDFILTGQFDARIYNRLIDYKFSGSLDFESKYMPSFQWRAYLDLDGRAEEFEYSVYQTYFMSPKRRMGPTPEELGLNTHFENYTVLDHVSYVCNKYPGMEEDVLAHMEAFLAWSVDNGWRGRSLAQFKEK